MTINCVIDDKRQKDLKLDLGSISKQEPTDETAIVSDEQTDEMSPSRQMKMPHNFETLNTERVAVPRTPHI